MLAQRLLFAHSEAGDLSRHLSAYFDTRTGAKGDPASYRDIARARCIPAAGFLFLSDIVPELDAARAAGMATLLVRRPGNAPVDRSSHRAIESFDEIA